MDNWCILGLADSAETYAHILSTTAAPDIDKDIYKYLVKAIYGKGMQVELRPLRAITA